MDGAPPDLGPAAESFPSEGPEFDPLSTETGSAGIFDGGRASTANFGSR